MGFRGTSVATAVVILGDLTMTVLRPTYAKADGSRDDVMEYVLLVVHALFCIIQAVLLFAFFSNTIWFTAGLIADLMKTVRATLPLWFVRFVLVVVPWVYRSFIGDGIRDSAFEDTTYIVLYVLDHLVALALWVSMLYTMSCMAEATMYAPYHKDAVAAELIMQEQMQENAQFGGAGGFAGDVVDGPASPRDTPPPQFAPGS
eukprot:CAMPEP_0174848974 /NCGR_PEP_ID=MMETSP1114-20130205/13834_1 /TAXON_ID=312471 /ORGANISM="Neobodo designis, Strain CCAP 1951/1" /LENGTH=201 /DNA_ID=CAMNT_0016083281 /DNA_START=50 /DNA_END=655 /DNA_ORIENTATION=+